MLSVAEEVHRKPFNADIMKRESGTQPKFTTKTTSRTGEAEGSGTTLMGPPDLYELFCTSLRETYWAEKHLVLNLPVMIEAATDTKLKKAISNHLEETIDHVERIEAVFQDLSEKPLAKKCLAMEALVLEGEAVLELTGIPGPVRDTGIIMASRKVEHHEIAAYRGLAHLADTLGLDKASKILNKTLEEEMKADSLLSEIADSQPEPGSPASQTKTD